MVPNRSSNPLWADKGLKLRYGFPIDPDRSHCDNIKGVVQRGPREELLESNSIDERLAQIQIPHDFAEESSLASLRLDHP